MSLYLYWLFMHLSLYLVCPFATNNVGRTYQTA